MKHKPFFQKITGVLLSGMMIANLAEFFTSSDFTASEVYAADTSMREISTMELVRDMGIGINLGNTLEACPNWYEDDWIAQWSEGKPKNYETAWGSPEITKEMIEGIAKEGFGVLRIPVAWSNMMAHDDTYTINAEYDARVHEIVDWTLESGMYAIINIHWDGGWVNNFPKDKSESMRRYTHMWEQIADSFKDYNDYLMFESQNEELGWESIWNPWGDGTGKAESYALCNEINQAFVDVIRSSGGNNSKRHLLISGYNTGIDRTCDNLFKMPNDPANRMAVSVHYYSPAGFAILEEDADWGKATPTWGSEQDYASLRSEMDMLKTNFIDKGIPVIIGEYGCPTTNKEPESVRRFLSSVCEEAYTRQLCPIMWSTPGGHYNRETYQLNDRQLHENLLNIVGDNVPTIPTTDPTTDPTTEPTLAPVIVGDTDLDGEITVYDLIIERKAVIGEISDETKLRAADIDGSGSVEINDLVLLQNYLLGKIKDFS